MSITPRILVELPGRLASSSLLAVLFGCHLRILGTAFHAGERMVEKIRQSFL